MGYKFLITMKKEILKRITLAGICICAVLSQTMGAEARDFYTITGDYLTVVEPRTEEEVRELLQRAEAGEAEAQYELAICYGRGNSVPQDYTEAFKWAMASAKQGYAPAEGTVGSCYQAGKGVEQNIEEAIKWIQRAADKGDMSACWNRGLFYLTGAYGAEQNLEKAAIYIRQAADAGHVQACRTMGIMHLRGDGVPRDMELGRQWLEKAAAQSDAESEVLLARMAAEVGNREEAISWTKSAAEHGHGGAAASLGDLYLTGEAVPQDLAQARLWYERGVELGNAQAQNDLGYMLLMGIGGEPDTERAKELFEAAIAQGYIRAATNLGLMYFEGNGVPQDKQKAVEITKPAANAGDSLAQRNMGIEACNTGDYAQGREWFLKAAEQGDPGGMLGLGKLYLEGRGGARDLQKARKYLEAAAASGEEVPEEILKELRSIHTE